MHLSGQVTSALWTVLAGKMEDRVEGCMDDIITGCFKTLLVPPELEGNIVFAENCGGRLLRTAHSTT